MRPFSSWLAAWVSGAAASLEAYAAACGAARGAPVGAASPGTSTSFSGSQLVRRLSGGRCGAAALPPLSPCVGVSGSGDVAVPLASMLEGDGVGALLASQPCAPPASLRWREAALLVVHSVLLSCTAPVAHHALNFTEDARLRAQSVEQQLADDVAQRLCLPARFQWGLALGDGARAGGVAARRGTAAAATAMLWPSAVRTADGGVAPRLCASAGDATGASGQRLAALAVAGTAWEVYGAAPVACAAPCDGGSRAGGGVMYGCPLEGYCALLHTARTQAVTRRGRRMNWFAGAEEQERLLRSVVLYCSDQVDPELVQAARLLGVAHIRVLQTAVVEEEHVRRSATESGGSGERVEVHRSCNYAMDVRQLRAKVVQDVAAGLYPMMVVGTFGSPFSGGVDPLVEMGQLCRELDVWFHIEAGHGGAALLAAPCAPCAAGGSGGACALGAALHDRCLQLVLDAAGQADSLHVGAASSYLPWSLLPVAVCGRSVMTDSGASFFFFSCVAKVAWAVQGLAEARHGTMNECLAPAANDVDVLHLTPSSHRSGPVLRHAYELAAVRMADAAAGPHGAGAASGGGDDALRVRCHQHFTWSVLCAVRADGRFDAPLDASLFGVVHLRWRTAADEATAALARSWCSAIDRQWVPLRVGGGAALPVKIYVGLTRIQRRLWVSVSFSQLPDDCRADATAAAGACGLYGELRALVLATLDEAARTTEPAASPSGRASL